MAPRSNKRWALLQALLSLGVTSWSPTLHENTMYRTLASAHLVESCSLHSGLCLLLNEQLFGPVGMIDTD